MPPTLLLSSYGDFLPAWVVRYCRTWIPVSLQLPLWGLKCETLAPQLLLNTLNIYSGPHSTHFCFRPCKITEPMWSLHFSLSKFHTLRLTASQPQVLADFTNHQCYELLNAPPGYSIKSPHHALDARMNHTRHQNKHLSDIRDIFLWPFQKPLRIPFILSHCDLHIEFVRQVRRHEDGQSSRMVQ